MVSGQKDMTQACAGIGAGAPFDVHASASLDATGMTGNNTADTCILLDSDYDGKVNGAVCPPLISPTIVPNNLPIQMTSFIGRKRQISEITQYFDPDIENNRCLSLVGSGGCGKTRLALEAADGLLSLFIDESGWWSSLQLQILLLCRNV